MASSANQYQSNAERFFGGGVCQGTQEQDADASPVDLATLLQIAQQAYDAGNQGEAEALIGYAFLLGERRLGEDVPEEITHLDPE
jgi:hypothetical protein